MIWCYRSVIDSQHFTNTLFSRGLKNESNHPFLAKFFNNRLLLSATRYLPDIVKLMIKLTHKKYIRIIERDGTQLSNKQFVENIRHGEIIDYPNKFYSIIIIIIISIVVIRLTFYLFPPQFSAIKTVALFKGF